LHVVGNDGVGPHHGVRPHGRPVEHDRARSDEAPAFDGAALEVGHVPDRAFLPHDGGDAGAGVADGAVLHIRAVADLALAVAGLEPFREKLFEEIKSRIKETDESPPVKKDDYWYYSRTVEGLQYAIHCRRRGSLEAPEEILLDENVLAEGHDFFALGGFEVS